MPETIKGTLLDDDARCFPLHVYQSADDGTDAVDFQITFEDQCDGLTIIRCFVLPHIGSQSAERMLAIFGRQPTDELNQNLQHTIDQIVRSFIHAVLRPEGNDHA